MFVPIPILILLGLLAAPTAAYLLVHLDAAMANRNRSLFGRTDDYRDDGTYTAWTNLLYLRIWTTTGCHSTLMLD